MSKVKKPPKSKAVPVPVAEEGFAVGNILSISPGNGIGFASGGITGIEGIRIGNFSPDVMEFRAAEFRAEARPQRGVWAGELEEIEMGLQVVECYGKAEEYMENPTYSRYVYMTEAIFSLARILGGLRSGEMMVAVVRRELEAEAFTLAGQTLLSTLIDLVRDDNFDLSRAKSEGSLPLVMAMARSAWVYIQGVRDAARSLDPLSANQIERYVLSKKILDVIQARCPLWEDDLVKHRKKLEADFGKRKVLQASVLERVPLEATVESRLALIIETAHIANAKRKAWFWLMLERASWREEKINELRAQLYNSGYPECVSRFAGEYALTLTEDKIVEMVSVIESRLTSLERGDPVTDQRLIELSLWGKALDVERATCPYGVYKATEARRQALMLGLQRNATMYQALRQRPGLNVTNRVRQIILEAALEERSNEACAALEYLVEATRNVTYAVFDEQ